MSTQAIHTTAGNHAGRRSQRGAEQYPTPACAVEALLRVEPLPNKLWEPCGPPDSQLVRTLEAHGHVVVAHDLVRDGIDFLQVTEAPARVGAILTNPPFSKAADFVSHGLALVPKVLVLERIQFLEAQERADLFKSEKLARVHVFRNRVPRMHKVDWKGKRAAASMCLAWFVFESDHAGAPTLHWVSWVKGAPE